MGLKKENTFTKCSNVSCLSSSSSAEAEAAAALSAKEINKGKQKNFIILSKHGTPSS